MLRTILLHVITVWYNCDAPPTIALHAALIAGPLQSRDEHAAH